MTNETPVKTPRTTTSGWIALLAGMPVAFVLGAVAQLGVFIGLGLCMDDNEAACEPGTWPTAAEFALATIPTYLIWLTPSLIAFAIGYRALRAGTSSGRRLMIVAAAVAMVVTAGCAAIWWL